MYDCTYTYMYLFENRRHHSLLWKKIKLKTKIVYKKVWIRMVWKFKKIMSLDLLGHQCWKFQVHFRQYTPMQTWAEKSKITPNKINLSYQLRLFSFLFSFLGFCFVFFFYFFSSLFPFFLCVYLGFIGNFFCLVVCCFFCCCFFHYSYMRYLNTYSLKIIDTSISMFHNCWLLQ